MTRDDLVQLVDDDSAKEIISVAKDIRSYYAFKSAIKIGVTVGLNDIPFEKMMVFSWIEEVINDRKTRI